MRCIFQLLAVGALVSLFLLVSNPALSQEEEGLTCSDFMTLSAQEKENYLHKDITSDATAEERTEFVEIAESYCTKYPDRFIDWKVYLCLAFPVNCF